MSLFPYQGRWLCYIIGQGLHVAMQVGSVAKARKIARRALLAEIWPAISVRVFLCTMGFMLFEAHPDLLYKLITWTGLEPADTSLDMSAPVSGFFGFGSDALLSFMTAKVPWLRREIPQVEETPSSTQPTQS